MLGIKCFIKRIHGIRHEERQQAYDYTPDNYKITFFHHTYFTYPPENHAIPGSLKHYFSALSLDASTFSPKPWFNWASSFTSSLGEEIKPFFPTTAYTTKT